MEHQKKQPEAHSELRDPKLPAVHGTSLGNRAQERVCPAPLPQTQIDS